MQLVANRLFVTSGVFSPWCERAEVLWRPRASSIRESKHPISGHHRRIVGISLPADPESGVILTGLERVGTLLKGAFRPF